MSPFELRLLVVDDYPDLRYLTRLTLEHIGYPNTDVAVDGVEALEMLQASTYDLVLSDLNMPRLDGFGLLRAIKADPALQRLPVIIMSANDDWLYANRATQLGAAGYLMKPVMDEALGKAIQKALADLGDSSS